MTEIFNGFIIKTRFKLVVSMLEEIHEAVMKRLTGFQKWSQTLNQAVYPRIIVKLVGKKNELGGEGYLGQVMVRTV